jgi:N-methylhydantoinase A
LHFTKHEFRPDSGGEGQFTGGCGVHLELELRTNSTTVANLAGDGVRHGARGMCGGEDGAPHLYSLHSPGEAPQVLPSKVEGVHVPAGSRFSIRSGGGYGPSTERTSAAREAEREAGLNTDAGVSTGRALMFRIAIDVGGTFTDLVAVDEHGHETLAKTPSTPANQAEGVMTGIGKLAQALGLSSSALLGRTERIVHGMTVATNALLERRGARVGLLTTAGHRDILEMREGLKPERYNLRLARPAPLVPRARRLGVVERLRFDGSVETELDMPSVDAALESLRQAQVDSVAICLLHAYRNSAHEQRVADRVRERMPSVYISQSSQVLPQIKEYQRLATTVINAYVGPLIERYLADLNTQLSHAGYAGPLLVMLSHGGVAPVEEAIRIAAGTVLSGPAGGVAGARRVAELSGINNLIPLDMGGTSTGISLIVDGVAALASDRQLANETIALKSLDIVTLGAGGGSIAAHGGGALIHVGPHSAGADPGPASYGHSGTLATVTDASVILDYLTPKRFMGGSTTLDTAASEQAVGALAETVQLDLSSMAAGIHRIVNTQMAEGIRLATVRRGVDPRRFTLLGFGGAAGLHVSALARMLNLERVLIPNMASVMSAWGKPD